MELANSESQFLKVGDTFAGVAFGYSSCDAHDEGYQGILSSLGVGSSIGATGAESIRVTSCPDELMTVDIGDNKALVFLPAMEEDAARAYVEKLVSESNPGPNELMAWWGENDFVLYAAKNAKTGQYIDELAAAFKNNAVYFGKPMGSNFSSTMYPSFVTEQFLSDDWLCGLGRYAE